MDVGDQLIRDGGDDRKGSNLFGRSRLLPVFPNAGETERRAVLHGNRVRLLCFLPLDRLPLEKPVHGTMQRRLQ